MRDLKADLNYVTVPVGIMKIKELYAIAEHALNRAITAEAEVERLQADMIDYRRGAVFMTKQIQDRDEELTLLRKVADLVSTMQESESGYSARLAEIEMLKVLDEYQTWKEGQDG